MTNLYRLLLILASVVAGVVNGSVLAGPVLIFMVYLLCVLVRQGRLATDLYYAERQRRLTDATALAR